MHSASAITDRRVTHGQSGTSEYRIWRTMRYRCENRSCREFHRYGGRGISVCRRWERFENFAKDMGPRPSSAHSIDRIDNDGNYEPSNCRWSTRQQQSQNRRNNVNIRIGGRSQCLEAWLRERGMNARTVRLRLNRGWSYEDALTPVKRRPRWMQGVCWHKRSGKWMASVVVNRRQQYLGLYETPQQAAKVVQSKNADMGRTTIVVPEPSEYREPTTNPNPCPTPANARERAASRPAA